MAAGDHERHDHAVAASKSLYVCAHLDHLAHEFVTENVSRLHLRNKAIIDVEIRAADRCCGYTNDDVARFLNARVRDRVDAHVLLSMPGQGFHSWLLYFGAQHPTAEIVPPPLSLAMNSRAYADLRKKPADDDQAIDDNAHGL